MLTPIREELKKLSLDGLLISDPTNIFYLSGFRPTDSKKKEAFLLISQDQSFLLLSPLDFHGFRKSQNRIQKINWNRDKSWSLTLKGLVSDSNIRALGFEAESLTVSELKIIRRRTKPTRLKPFPKTIERMRIIKTSPEIKKIKRACQITDRSFDEILKLIRPGITESEIAHKIEFILMKNGAESSAFKPIVAFGKNAAVPHYQSGKTKLSTGGLILDFGARHEGYCADLTRTVYLGNPDSQFRKIYRLVFEAQEKALTKIKAGMKAKRADHFCRDLFAQNDLADHFTHSTGHGIGLEIHEGFAVSPYDQTEIVQGMVFTLEPGLYFKNWGGIRIENTVMMGDTEIKSLSSADRELICL